MTMLLLLACGHVAPDAGDDAPGQESPDSGTDPGTDPGDPTGCSTLIDPRKDGSVLRRVEGATDDQAGLTFGHGVRRTLVAGVPAVWIQPSACDEDVNGWCGLYLLEQSDWGRTLPTATAPLVTSPRPAPYGALYLEESGITTAVGPEEEGFVVRTEEVPEPTGWSTLWLFGAVPDAPVTLDLADVVVENVYQGDAWARVDVDGDGVDDVYLPLDTTRDVDGFGFILSPGSGVYDATVDADIWITTPDTADLGPDAYLTFADLDDDGYPDAAWRKRGTEGDQVLVRLGPYQDGDVWDGPDAAYGGPSSPDRLGRAPNTGWDVPRGIDAVADVTGDGRSDLLLSSTYSANGEQGVGTTWILDWYTPGAHDVTTLTGLTSEALPDSSEWGMNLGGVGDFDGDGWADVLLAHDATEGIHEGYLYLGPLDATFAVEERRILVHTEPENVDSDNVSWTGVAGDLDGDGRAAFTMTVQSAPGEGQEVWLVNGCGQGT